MQAKVMGALGRVRQTFGSFSPGQKAVTICVLLGVLIGGVFFAKWAAQPTYGPLFSNLSSKDASAMVDKLTTDGIPYKLTDGGKTILVPQKSVYDLRLAMSGAGLPAEADTGYALLDKQGVTTSDFMQQVGYQRALEGELTNTIKQIGGVTDATVHLAIPKKDVFADDVQKPTASVLITSGAGKTLDQGQVQTVVHLVSSSVEGMSPDDVTVADSTGAVLSTGGAGGAAATGNSREQQTQSFEQRMSKSLQDMLRQVVGPNGAVVKVTADLDYDQTETKSQNYVYDPNTPPLSESSKRETYTGGGTPTGGVLGPDNIQVPGGTGDSGDYNSTQETRDNAVGVVTETRKSAPGAVNKLNVAVLLDSASAAAVDTAEVQNIVSSAAGLDTARGDSIAVSAMQFDKSTATQTAKQLATEKAAEKQKQTMTMIKTIAAAVLILLLFLIAWWRGRRKRKGLSQKELAEVEALQAELDASRARALEAAATREAIEGPTEVDAAELDQEKREGYRSDIAKLVEQQPEEMAQLLRGWLADRRS